MVEQVATQMSVSDAVETMRTVNLPAVEVTAECPKTTVSPTPTSTDFIDWLPFSIFIPKSKGASKSKTKDKQKTKLIGKTLWTFITNEKGVTILTEAEITEAVETDSRKTITLYRGVAGDHEGYQEALQGIARPRGGHNSPAKHNSSDTGSIFTSWTPYRLSAEMFALNGDTSFGALLTKEFEIRGLIPSQDTYNEAEVLVAGIVTGASVEKINKVSSKDNPYDEIYNFKKKLYKKE